MRDPTRGLIVALAICGMCVGSVGVASATADPTLPGLQEFLSTRDVVVEGTLLDVTESHHSLPGGCGFPALGSSSSAHDLVVRVTAVLSGVVEDSLMTVTTSQETPLWTVNGHVVASFSSDKGTHVIAYAKRVCEDSWRFWGGYLRIDQTGHVAAPTGGMSADTGGPPFTLERNTLVVADLSARLLHRKGETPLGAFDDALGVILLRVTHLEPLSKTRGYFALTESLGVVAGSTTRAPTRIDVPLTRYCGGSPFVGDTIALPLKTAPSNSGTSQYDCLLPFLVHDDFVPSLGVRVEDVRGIYATGGRRLRLAGVHSTRR